MDKVMFSSMKYDWETPAELFEELDKEFHFTLDPCSSRENAKCKKYYTAYENGLLHSWQNETVFCNPPYGQAIYDWVKKCANESKNRFTTIVLLIPARTDTRYFHEFIYGKVKEIRFLKGRLRFGGAKHPAPFPSMIVVF